LLANDVGGDGVARELTGATMRGGRFSASSDGSFFYEPPSTTFWGDDAFDYTLTDGEHETTGRVHLVVQPDTLDFDDIGTTWGNGFAVDLGFAETAQGECIAAAGDTDGDGLGDIAFIANGRGYLLLGPRRSSVVQASVIGREAGGETGTVFTFRSDADHRRRRWRRQRRWLRRHRVRDHLDRVHRLRRHRGRNAGARPAARRQ
jgi:hypothetical protein